MIVKKPKTIIEIDDDERILLSKILCYFELVGNNIVRTERLNPDGVVTGFEDAREVGQARDFAVNLRGEL